jgi:hypothetical protein
MTPFFTAWVEIPPSMASQALRDKHPDAWKFIAGSTYLLGRSELLATGIFPVTACVQEAVRSSVDVMADRAEAALARLQAQEPDGGR